MASRKKQIHGPHRTTVLPAALRAELLELGHLNSSGKVKAKREGRSGRRIRDPAFARAQKRRKSNTNIVETARSSEDVTVSDDIQNEVVSTRPDSTSLITPLEKLLFKQISSSRKEKQHISLEESSEDREIAWLEAMLGVRPSTSSKDKGKWKNEMDEDGLGETNCYSLELFDDIQSCEKNVFAAEEEDEEIIGRKAKIEKQTLPRSETSLCAKYLNPHLILSKETEGLKATSPGREGYQQRAKGGTEMTSASSSESKTCRLAEDPAQTKYIPPCLRVTSGQSAAKSPLPSETEGRREVIHTSVQRRLMGLLNRLSPLNIASIVASLEQLYSNNPRALVSAALVCTLLDVIFVRDVLGEQFLVTYAALVANLARVIGREVSAGILVECVIKLEASLKRICGSHKVHGSGCDGLDDFGSKICQNIVGFLAELYNFQVIACTLLYDLIGSFLSGGLNELVVELLVTLIKRSGQRLRQDDPEALKEIVGLVRGNLQNEELAQINSRTKFMLESLLNLKNNKFKIAPRMGLDLYSDLKKYVSNTRTRPGSSTEPLRLTLDDIRRSSSKGKWWLTGAAWSGNPLAHTVVDKHSDPLSSISASLRLAQAQGMNTDIRKAIFEVIMGSEDYLDAHKNLLLLKLSSVQEREIARVLLQCCGNEANYNPYYTLIVRQMAATSHSFQITLQYALWDFIRELGERSVGGENLVENLEHGIPPKVSNRRLSHIAKLYAWCVASDALNMLIFKPVPFQCLHFQTKAFLQQFFQALFLSAQCASPALVLSLNATHSNRQNIEQIFIRIAPVQSLVNGLVNFLDSWNSTLRDKLRPNLGEAELSVVEFGIKAALDTLETGIGGHGSQHCKMKI